MTNAVSEMFGFIGRDVVFADDDGTERLRIPGKKHEPVDPMNIGSSEFRVGDRVILGSNDWTGTLKNYRPVRGYDDVWDVVVENPAGNPVLAYVGRGFHKLRKAEL